jgi:hypothetical protein
MWRIMNSEIRRCNDLREEGKLGELIKRLTNDSPNKLDLQILSVMLPSAEHGQPTDPEEIQAEVNNCFHKWYAIPENLDPTAR